MRLYHDKRMSACLSVCLLTILGIKFEKAIPPAVLMQNIGILCVAGIHMCVWSKTYFMTKLNVLVLRKKPIKHSTGCMNIV